MMNEQQVNELRANLNQLIGDAKNLRVPPILQAQTGQFALIQGIQIAAKVEQLINAVAVLNEAQAAVAGLAEKVANLDQLQTDVTAVSEQCTALNRKVEALHGIIASLEALSKQGAATLKALSKQGNAAPAATAEPKKGADQ